MKSSITYLALTFASFSLAQAAINWTGNGDGLSLFQESNWVDSNTNQAPLPNTINPGTALNGGTPETYVLGGVNLSQIGAGNIVLGNAGTTITLDNSSVATDPGVANGTVGAGILNLTNSSAFSSQYVTDSLITNVDDTSSLILYGGDKPMNFGAIVNLSAGATLTFNNETISDAASEHYGSIFINGTALSSLTEGVDFTHISNGGNGSIITAVPESSSFALLAGCFGLGWIMLRRR